MSIRSMVLSALILAVLLLGSLQWMNRRAIDRLNQELGAKRVELINLELVLRRQDDQVERLIKLSQQQAQKASQAVQEAAKSRAAADRRIKELMARRPITDDLCVAAERMIDETT